MGDIIWGTFLVVLSVGVFGVYRFSTRKKINQRSFPRLVSLLIVLGGIVGLLTNGLNERLLDEEPYLYFLTVTFFGMQTLASVLYYRTVFVGLLFLIFTLLLQVPIVRAPNYSYNSQTLFSLRVEPSSVKILNIEPGSYVHFIYFDADFMVVENSKRKSDFGLNVIPLLTIAILAGTRTELPE